MHNLVYHTRRSVVGLLLLAFVISAGCDSGPKTFPVSGKVVDKSGKPWSGGTITFQLASDPTMGITGEIQKDGAFTLTTNFASGNAAKALTGAPAGEYTVTVEPSYGDELPTVIKGYTVKQKFTVKEAGNDFRVEVTE